MSQNEFKYMFDEWRDDMNQKWWDSENHFYHWKQEAIEGFIDSLVRLNIELLPFNISIP